MNTVTVDAGDDVAAIVEAFGACLSGPTDALCLLVRFRVREPDRETVRSAFQSVRNKTLHEPGCGVFELDEEAANPGGFVIYERWRSLADLETHLRKGHTAELRALFHSLIIEGPDFQVLRPAA